MTFNSRTFTYFLTHEWMHLHKNYTFFDYYKAIGEVNLY